MQPTAFTSKLAQAMTPALKSARTVGDDVAAASRPILDTRVALRQALSIGAPERAEGATRAALHHFAVAGDGILTGAAPAVVRSEVTRGVASLRSAQHSAATLPSSVPHAAAPAGPMSLDTLGPIGSGRGAWREMSLGAMPSSAFRSL